MNTELKVSQSDLYEVDYYLWLQDTIEKLKHQNYEQVDWKNLVDEIEDMPKRERRSLESNLVVVLLHLLKWQYQSGRRSGSWSGSIIEHRRRIRKVLRDSPSLKNYLEEVLVECYESAAEQASAETELPIETLPGECPYSIDQILEADLSEFS
ncbi:DUF29 domain-containing protein [Leptolyngbya sp. AN03gr2]|uniref:DUF29 domain-containing protein n=1 Tax=unclassified Leptolyngbya TaxID=2650499 RepID=UPI003D31DABE